MKHASVGKYRPYPQVDLPNRIWPSNTITHAPIWCSVDLRDGNRVDHTDEFGSKLLFLPSC